ncbi:MAG: hypothetical protein H6712_24315 [Myxococcales bacterium]|nr:hypothetical protein [Myxococcales bacterium]
MANKSKTWKRQAAAKAKKRKRDKAATKAKAKTGSSSHAPALAPVRSENESSDRTTPVQFPYSYSRDEEVADISVKAPHVVILGAGASRAACLQGDAQGRKLPVMYDLIDTLEIGPLIPEALRSLDFESAYAAMRSDESLLPACEEVEERIFGYFASLELPPYPNVYDHLVLSLRPKDVIATFNWDPFLIQAIQRAYHVGYQPPRVLFLHGNVKVGFCQEDGVVGVRDVPCSRCGNPLSPSRLLYPIGEKNYQQDPVIWDEWRELSRALKSTYWLTIFGYGAPKSDKGAIDLFREAWGHWEQRQFEQIEIIDIRPEDELADLWDDFIHTHHYEVHRSFYDCSLARHPRRTGEFYRQQYLEARWCDENPLPRELDRLSLWRWLGPLLEAEGPEAMMSFYRKQ